MNWRLALAGSLWAVPAILLADRRGHVGEELFGKPRRDFRIGRDNGDRGLGRGKLARFRAPPDQRFPFIGLIIGAKAHLSIIGLERSVPAYRRADDVGMAGLGRENVPAHACVLRVLCATCRAAPSALLVA